MPNAVGKWDWKGISMFIHMDDVLKHPDRPWHRTSMSYNEWLCKEVMNAHMPNATGYWDDSYCMSVMGDKHLPDYLDMKTIRNGQRILHSREMDVYIPMDYVLANTHIGWDRTNLSMNENITVSVIHAPMPNAVGIWDWYDISKHIGLDDVLQHPHLPWNIEGLSHNEKIPIAVLMRMQD